MSAYLAGCACLAVIAAVSVWTIAATVLPNRHRILAALCGQPVSPPAASIPPHRDTLYQLRVVEADVEPTCDRIVA